MDILGKESGNLVLSGERFSAVYRLVGSADEARAAAHHICIEQSIEFPEDLVGRRDIREQIVGQLVSFRTLDALHHEAEISYAVEIVGAELTQLLNVLLGNISLKAGIRLQELKLPDALLEKYRGPRFGRQGIRELLGVPHRPLLCTAVKPMGLSPEELAEFAYRFALGGMDMIKDDHGLADQEFCPFRERVARCAEAVRKANEETGRCCLYLPNVTAPADRILERALLAKELGAAGLLVAAGLTGLDAMRSLADSDEIGLPILSHPAFWGTFTVTIDQGISPGVLYGQVNRLAGADACIFPNYGGRFTSSAQDCREAAASSGCSMGRLKPIFPMPGGGLRLDRLRELIDFYGSEVILMIGGDVHRHGADLAANCRKFADLIRNTS